MTTLSSTAVHRPHWRRVYKLLVIPRKAPSASPPSIRRRFWRADLILHACNTRSGDLDPTNPIY